MPSASRHRDAPSTFQRGVLVAAALAVGALVGSFGTPARSSAAIPAATRESGSSLTLAGQTSWVRGQSGLELQLRIATSLPVSRLGLKFVLYSRLTSRSDFEQSIAGVAPSTELPVDAPALVPLSALDHRRSADGSVTIRFPIETSPSSASGTPGSPRLDLSCGNQCDGVYPLEAALVDSSDGNLLASVTTHLVYTAGTSGTLPLNVSLVLPIGTMPALDASGSPVISTTRLRSLQKLLAVVAAYPQDRITLELYPQLLVALERQATARGASKLARQDLAALDALLAHQGSTPPSADRQVLGATFSPVDPTALVNAGLSGEMKLQLARGSQALDSGLGRDVQATPYVAYGQLDASSLSLLEADGVRQLVVPSVTTPAGSTASPVALTSPFKLLPPASSGSGSGSGSGTAGTSGPVALLADPELAAHFNADPGDPELAAHQLLADFAELYFDAPDEPVARGVVAAPATWVADPKFLSAVLAGLSDSPILHSLTLGQAFELPASSPEELTPLVPGATAPISSAPVVKARRDLGIVKSVEPDAKTQLSRLGDAILLGESTGISRSSRVAYDATPLRALGGLQKSLTINGGKTVTLTSTSGEIPINIVSSSAYPIHALLELRDSQLAFRGNGAHSQHVTFGARTTAPRNYKVSSHSSGASQLHVVVVSPTGGVDLLVGSINVSSTAVSGVAIAMSIGALLVLGAWWTRSVLRHRRRATQARAVALLPSGEPPAPA